MKFDIKSYKELRLYIASDLYRYMTSCSIRAFLRGWYIAGFRYTFFLRCCRYFRKAGLFYQPFYFLCRYALRHYSIKYGFQIPWQTDIGPGLFIGHYGPIIVNPNSRIGINCNLSVDVLIGLSHKPGAGFSYPTIGDRVALNNSCKVIGGVKIASDSMIGVGAVVTKDVSEVGSIVIGVPGKVISYQGSSAYVGSFHPWTKVFITDEEES